MIRPINITAVSNGFIVQVGCQQVVFTSVGDLCDLLSKYLRNPEDTEKNFMATAANVRHTMGSVPAPAYETTPGSIGQLANARFDQYAVAGAQNRDPRHPNSISEYATQAVPTTTAPINRY